MGVMFSPPCVVCSLKQQEIDRFEEIASELTRNLGGYSFGLQDVNAVCWDVHNLLLDHLICAVCPFLVLGACSVLEQKLN